jgi:ABC-type transport system involved in resistance to organic solvents, ATPase component
MHGNGEPTGSERHLVLDIREASSPTSGPSLALAPITLAVPAGSLLLIDVADWRQATVLTDLATGQMTPDHGSVRFLDRDWAELPSVHAEAMRGRIGHVFRRGNWIDSLSVLDNILLPQRYHTRRPVAELEADAVEIATRLRLPGVPVGFPADIDPEDLQRAACIRAFLGRPALVLLCEPTQGLAADIILEPLVNVVRHARDRDAAVIWFTENRAIWSDPSLPATARYRLRDAFHRIVTQPAGGAG